MVRQGYDNDEQKMNEEHDNREEGFS